MSQPMPIAPRSPIAVLQRMAAAKTLESEAIERCEFCGIPIPPDHHHFTHPILKKFICACDICALSKVDDAACKRLPQRIVALQKFNLSEQLWHELEIPVGMAFFVLSNDARRPTAYYPMPGGIMQSQLPLTAWREMSALNSILNELSPEVEALLVRRTVQPYEYYVVPVDVCYHLAGLMRTTWKGLSGGVELVATLERFFDNLKRRCSN